MIRKMAFAAVMTAGLMAPVNAADKGGVNNGLADLDERVSELEATVARKGTRKVTVTLSGSVHKGMLWHDIDGAPGDNKGAFFDPGHDPTRIRIDGTGKISKSWMAGFVVEFAVTNSTAQGIDSGKALIAIPAMADGKNEFQIGDQGTYIRHSFLYLEGPVGRISLGQTSGATDGVTEVSLGNTLVASRPLSLSPMQFGNALAVLNVPFDGYRSNVARWDSPALAGFIASASWSDSETWEASLKWAGEFSGVRLAAAVGYRDASRTVVDAVNVINLLDLLTLDVTSSHKSFAGSASIKHMGTGLFATAFASKVNMDLGISLGILPPLFVFSGPLGSLDVVGYGAQIGWEKNITGLGNTSIYAEWQRTDSKNVTGPVAFTRDTTMGVTVVQSIDAFAMDLYLGARKIDAGDASGFCLGICEDATVITSGAKIRF